MRTLLSILLLLSINAFPQTIPWAELKASIKKETDKDKQDVLDFYQGKKIPISFSDGKNHFLMVAVHPSGKPIYLTTLNAEAAISTGTSIIQNGATGFSLDGTGQHIFQWDAGLVKSHIEFGDRVVATEGSTPENHATHVAGILTASGVNAQAKGMAPNANLHAYYFDNDISEMASQAEANQYGYVISNHSYGSVTGWNRSGGSWSWHGDELVSSEEDFTAGFYSLRTRQIDQIAFLAPYHTIVWAAGNDRADVGIGGHPPDCNGGTGYDCIIQEGTAKNIITVGGVPKVLNYTGPASVPMSFFSSWGPTDDGRIKPDLVGAGLNLFSTSANGVDGYTTLGGTSMSTPNVAGSLLLLQEVHGKLNGGQWMKAATLKGLAIHTAKETGTAPGPDYSFGWGLFDAAEGARHISQRDDKNISILEGRLGNDETHEWILLPQANKKITATLVWTDPAGVSPGAVLDPPHAMLVNDLDMRLIDENGMKKFPWILDPGSPASAATRGDNTRDNVEKLEFDFPEAKPYRLTVSHKGYLVNDGQSYSLIISYQSQSATKTFYWIGGQGSWNDASHWSLTSGGAPAGLLPTQNDRVFVDENSFAVGGNILLPANVKCASLRWWLNKAAGIDFNGNRLEIENELTLASSGFKKTGHGRFVLSSLDSGRVHMSNAISQRPDLEFVSGQWQLRGNLHVDSLIVSGGAVQLVNADLSVNHFAGQSSATEFRAVNSVIHLSESWKSDASKIQITSEGSEIQIESDTIIFQATNLVWHGTLSVLQSNITIVGSLELDSLYAGHSSNISIAPTNVITVDNGFEVKGLPGKRVEFEGAGTSSMHFNFHEKRCLDFMNVTQVNLSGDGVINLGPNSTIQNSSGWLQQDCEAILFPDFEVRYNCANALTEFINTSTGPAESYQWNFGDAISNQIHSDKENPIHQFSEPGVFTVSLTVSGAGTTVVYSKPITIVSNTLAETDIEYNSEIMFSSTEAGQYQWFENGELISNETNRIFSYQGNEGLFQVVIYDALCNRPSSPLLISGVGENSGADLSLYPVPAADKLYFNLPNAEALVVKDCLGRSIEVPWNAGEGWADVSWFENGLYVLVIKKEGRENVKKFLVRK